MKFYSESHEWIEVNHNVGTVGITQYAQHELGEIVYIELPKVGEAVRMGQEVCVLESTKAAADVYAPVSGKIVAVNDALRAHVDLINQGAESGAWLFRIELSHPKDLEHLLSESQYKKLIKYTETT